MQHSKSRPNNKAAPRTEPITIPAIWPRDKVLEETAAAPAVLDADGDGTAEVEDGNNGGTENIGGIVTSSHRAMTFEATQQESVALGELAPQYPHKP